MQPLVRAAVVPGFAGPQPGAGGGWQPGGAIMPNSVVSPVARGGELLRVGIWLLASVAGAGLGIVLSSTLITLLH
jgi:hypothetical protein